MLSIGSFPALSRNVPKPGAYFSLNFAEFDDTVSVAAASFMAAIPVNAIPLTAVFLIKFLLFIILLVYVDFKISQ
jgi:hypothetical protein